MHGYGDGGSEGSADKGPDGYAKAQDPESGATVEVSFSWVANKYVYRLNGGSWQAAHSRVPLTGARLLDYAVFLLREHLLRLGSDHEATLS